MLIAVLKTTYCLFLIIYILYVIYSWLILMINDLGVQEGMTPLNHLSQGPGNEKLRDLLLWHLEQQRKRRAIVACSETKAKMDALENELSNIVGLHALKLQLRKWAKGMLLDERRRALGLKVGARKPPHMAFLGNPGTGIFSSHVAFFLPFLVFFLFGFFKHT